MSSETITLTEYRGTRGSTRGDKKRTAVEALAPREPPQAPVPSLPSRPSSSPSPSPPSESIPPFIPASLGSRPSSIAIDGVYTLILERTCTVQGDLMHDLTVPIQVSVGYERNWPLLLLADDRPADVAEEGYLYQGNYAACFAIRHLSRAANTLKCNIRQSLGLREGAPFSLTLPGINNTAITCMTVVKSLVNQLVEDKYNTRPVDQTPTRASLLGLDLCRLRVDYDPADNMMHSNYVARVHIHPRPAGSTSSSRAAGVRSTSLTSSSLITSSSLTPEESRIVHFPVKPNMEFKKVVQMVQNLVDTIGPCPRRIIDNMRLFYDDAEIPYDKGVVLGETMFRLTERTKCVDLEVRWAE